MFSCAQEAAGLVEVQMIGGAEVDDVNSRISREFVE
jgi:hypothetical protein